jgi:16S rRNA (cytosine967-C5)-methyltransferase
MSDAARTAALAILADYERSLGNLSILFERGMRRHPKAAPHRAFVSALVHGEVRHRRLLDALLDRHLRDPGRLSPTVRRVMRLGALQLLFLDGVPESAAVNTSVDLAKRLGGGPVGGMVNAVLRKVAAGKGEPADPSLAAAVRHSFPDWLAARWSARFGQAEAEELMAASNLHPGPTLRVDTRRITRMEAMEELAAEGHPGIETRHSASGVTLGAGYVPARSRLFAGGLVAVQDEAFQCLGELLPAAMEGPLLDACAGLGGKAIHQAWRTPARLVAAVDLSGARLAALAAEARRLGIASIAPCRADATRPPFAPGSFALAVLDAPCSATGIIRRRPDVKWNRDEADLARMAALQRGLLDAVLPLVRPGGLILYITCSLEPEEGEEVVADFLARHPAASAVDPVTLGAPADLVTPAGFIRTYPHRHRMDGAFAAFLRAGAQP